MSRSVWKGPFMDLSILKLSTFQKQKVWSRSSTIPAFLIGEYVFIYNGKEFKKVFITRDKVGYKFGEFSFTRKNVSKIKLSINKRKKN
jgi:small subunit ribosomal protein S19